MKKRGHWIVEGRVQGVCYRMLAQEEAERLSLTGFVRNRRDGAVEVVAEGEEQVLVCFLEWCRRGPPYATVTDVKVEYSEPTNEFDTFSVAY